MRSRGQAAAVQLVAFVGGGILAPAWHVAHHRNDHTHGADGPSIAFHLADAGGSAHGHPHPAADEPLAEPVVQPDTHRHRHPHPHRHGHAYGHAGAHAESAHMPAVVHEPAPQPPPSSGRHAATPLPVPLDHGHASIAHFGLALLGAPALLTVPAPQPREWVLVSGSTAALRLFHPSFPRPRPPPPSSGV